MAKLATAFLLMGLGIQACTFDGCDHVSIVVFQTRAISDSTNCIYFRSTPAAAEPPVADYQFL
jgi:hypothetical protein